MKHCLYAALIPLFFSACNVVKSELKPTQIGICTNLANGEKMQQYGYAYVEEGVSRFLAPTKPEEEFERILNELANSPLPVKACNSFIPGSLKSVGNEADHKNILTFAETAFRRAQRAGVEIIVFGSGGSRSIPEGFPREKAREQFIELGRKMAPIAQKYNVTIVLEPLNSTECNFINSVSEGGEIVKEINHRHFMLLADLYHMKMENEGPDTLVKYGKLIRHVHIAEKQDRAVPGTYDEDFRPYVNALKKMSYTGKISIEARWRDFDSQIPTAIETIKRQINS
ncbi:MAG: sugar phosphate isomerase/epimerase family protein [Petrimonas sp.]|jgi:sugar phosphate isomerase/epimerase|uniref:sugar phosphate isomerase/epimerase family protein n=1 Tax=Petrimonas sp. TaxID=2023866 RepID=UPI002B3CD4EE|nr:sugar phosphate isomerase/epimerase family protein [Petrimonas sp.]MEA4996906.1 sugar phosphate isomerase/epimerase family protein [Petrimonas sp.]MEA5044618.1 sugar phosphate isomerase/epimerase family protein [Petrimonas sp.]